MTHAIINIRIENEADITRLRQIASMVAETLDFGTFARTRSITAILELARNALEYAGGGQARLGLDVDKGHVTFQTLITDQGPGIDGLDQILAGQSDGSGGLGLGLRGVKSIAHGFLVHTSREGTSIDVTFLSDLPATDILPTVQKVQDALARSAKVNPFAELAQQNRDLLEAVAARDLLMKEVHHRTSNNLSLINGLIRMSAARADDPKVRQVLDELQARVNAIIVAHEQLQRTSEGDNLSLIAFLRNLTKSSENAFNTKALNVSVKVAGDDVKVDGKVAIDIGLIVGELITNAYKHAFSSPTTGQIDVRLKTTTEGLSLVVGDDGVGLADGAERPERSNSLGWQLIRMMSQQYGGSIEVLSRDGLEVTIILRSALT